MRPVQITFINGLVLTGLSLWSYFSSDTPSFTALIPTLFGVLFLILAPSFQKGNKTVAHIVVVLTAILIIALVKPLTAALGRDDMTAIIRVAVMIFTSLVAMIVYIRSFIAARRQ